MFTCKLQANSRNIQKTKSSNPRSSKSRLFEDPRSSILKPQIPRFHFRKPEKCRRWDPEDSGNVDFLRIFFLYVSYVTIYCRRHNKPEIRDIFCTKIFSLDEDFLSRDKIFSPKRQFYCCVGSFSGVGRCVGHIF